jgi:hypothetical protein
MDEMKERIKQMRTEPRNVDAIKLLKDITWYAVNKRRTCGIPYLMLDEILGLVIDAYINSKNTTEEQTVGTWKFDDFDEAGITYKCSCCNYGILLRDKSILKPDKCPQCKAFMK